MPGAMPRTNPVSDTVTTGSFELRNVMDIGVFGDGRSANELSVVTVTVSCPVSLMRNFLGPSMKTMRLSS
jgi:hypothetical protein